MERKWYLLGNVFHLGGNVAVRARRAGHDNLLAAGDVGGDTEHVRG